MRDPQPCTAPTANLLASCLILTERGWGERNTTHKFAPSVIQGERKKTQSSPRFTSPPELQRRKKRHTHIHTRSKGKRDPTCSFIPLSCSLTATWTWAVQRGSIQKVWLQTAEQQPPISNVHVTLAWHFFLLDDLKAPQKFSSPPLTSVKPE